ncbi:MAG: amidohydrolase [Alphaproteobacteria bacterium]|nr:amidohydrolase [Alphaproteobacteria bacterium]
MCVVCNPGLSVVASALTDHTPASRRGFMVGGLSVAALVAMPAAAEAVVAQLAGGPADVIFHNGAILPMAGGAPKVEALALREGRILAVGSADVVKIHGGAQTRIIDLRGRTLLPGFVDPHVHTVFVQFDDWLDITPMRTSTMSAVKDALRRGVAATPAGEWVRAHGFDRGIIKGGHAFTLAELDEVAPNNPLFIIEINAHIGYVNSKALALAGISRDAPDPPGGRFVRDANGLLTGRLEEGGAFRPFLSRMPRVKPEQMQAGLARLFQRAASVGCTGLHDCGIGFLSGEHDLEALQIAMAANPPVRLRGMLAANMMDVWQQRGLKPGFGNDRFRVGGMKLISDGSNPGRTGYMREPYLGETSRGAMNYTLEALTEAIAEAHALGWQVGVHANGDAAIDVVLDAFEAVLRDSPRPDHRHRLEHCSLLHPEQIERMQKLGLSPSFLIGHVRWWGRAFRDNYLGPERARFYDPCASALKGGLRVSLHSDYGVTPLEPLRYVEDAVARIMADGGEVLNPDERIPVMAALRAVTIDAAWQCRMDDLTGSLEPGKYADLVLLEEDPTEVDPSAISHIPVSETWLAGAKRYPV